MRRDLGDGLGIVEIIAILEALPFGDLGLGGHDLAGFPDEPANRVAHGRHLADGFGEDVPHALEHLLARFEPFFGADEFLGRGREIGEGFVAGPDPERQGLEALLAGLGGLASLLGLEGKIKILEPLGIVGRANGGGQVGRELSLAVDRLEDRLFPLGQLAQPLHAKLDLADDHLVEVAGRFLAVSRDEGNGVPIVQEPNDALDLRAPNLQVLRDTTQVHLNRVAHVDSTRHLVRQERRRCVRPIQGIARNSHLNGKSLALLKASARRHLPTKRVRSL